MPLFYFNVHDGADLPDPDGVDLPDLDAARQEAVRRTALVLAGNNTRLLSDADWRLDITDERGNVLYWIDVAAESVSDAQGASRPGR